MWTSETLAVAGPFARPYGRRLLAAGALVVAETGVVLLRPWPLALAVDLALVPDRPAGLGPLTVLTAAAGAGILLTAVLGQLRLQAERLSEGTAERIGHDVRSELFDRAVARSLSWHDRARSGELVTRMTTDVGRVLDGVVAMTTTLVPEVLLLLGVLVLIAVLDPALALVAVAVIPGLAWLTLDQRRRVRRAEGASREAAGHLAATAQDIVRHVRTVQAFGREDLARSTFGAASRAQADADVEAVRTASRWSPLADGVLAVGTAAVLLVGGSRVLDGALSLGALLVVLAYLRDLYGPVRSLTRLSALLAKADVSARRLRDLLASRETLRVAVDARPAPPVRDEVRLDGVSFSYRHGPPVLSRLDLTLRAGETVCVLGPSGAGKSTLLHLLLRLYDVDAGRVLLDGVDVRDCTLASVRAQFALLPQDPWLLDDTLAANVAVGRRGASRSEVELACRRAQVDEFASRLPLGIDSRIGEDAALLSGGQRRRVALARAVLSSAPVLLLDEPTASLDDRSALCVTSALRAIVADRSALLVTHDPRVADIADRVVWLDPARTDGPPRRPPTHQDVREEVRT